MSKESYLRGFCKFAEKHGMNPEDLDKMSKRASLWDDIKGAWDAIPDENKPLARALLGAGGGALGGAALGNLFGFSPGKGALVGAGRGGMGGYMIGDGGPSPKSQGEKPKPSPRDQLDKDISDFDYDSMPPPERMRRLKELEALSKEIASEEDMIRDWNAWKYRDYIKDFAPDLSKTSPGSRKGILDNFVKLQQKYKSWAIAQRNEALRKYLTDIGTFTPNDIDYSIENKDKIKKPEWWRWDDDRDKAAWDVLQRFKHKNLTPVEDRYLNQLRTLSE